MGWRNWVGYPGMLQDENMMQAVKALQTLADNVDVIAKAVLDLQQRVKKLEERR